MCRAFPEWKKWRNKTKIMLHFELWYYQRFDGVEWLAIGWCGWKFNREEIMTQSAVWWETIVFADWSNIADVLTFCLWWCLSIIQLFAFHFWRIFCKFVAISLFFQKKKKLLSTFFRPLSPSPTNHHASMRSSISYFSAFIANKSRLALHVVVVTAR